MISPITDSPYPSFVLSLNFTLKCLNVSNESTKMRQMKIKASKKYEEFRCGPNLVSLQGLSIKFEHCGIINNETQTDLIRAS